MPAVKADQITVPDHRYACTSCGQCCRRWHVFLTPEDLARLKTFEWTPEDDIPEQLTTHIQGNDYLAHHITTDDDRCIYLDTTDNLCKIHRKYGLEAKPLGCRVYPYTIVSTFPQRYSVTARFDCPAVREGHGQSVRKDMPEIRAVMAGMSFGPGFTADDLDGLNEKAAGSVLDYAFRELLNHKTLPTTDRLVGLVLVAERLERLGADFLNNSELDMRQVLPAVFERVRTDVAVMPLRRLGAVERWRFMTLLTAYLRRDEQMIRQGVGARVQRLFGMVGLLFGGGNAQILGPEHPAYPLNGAQLFRTPVANADTVDWTLYLDLVRVRLQAWQFMGPAHYSYAFYHGLRAFLLTFPLVIAAAKWHALARDPAVCTILPEDLDYAVGAIDHNYGRSPLLNVPLFAAQTRQMGEPDSYNRLVRHLLRRPGPAGS